jgi:hypothetical protein
MCLSFTTISFNSHTISIISHQTIGTSNFVVGKVKSLGVVLVVPWIDVYLVKVSETAPCISKARGLKSIPTSRYATKYFSISIIIIIIMCAAWIMMQLVAAVADNANTHERPQH